MKTTKFNTRADMLEVIHTMYQYTLDHINPVKCLNGDYVKVGSRLSYEKQIELGRKLARYWDVKK